MRFTFLAFLAFFTFVVLSGCDSNNQKLVGIEPEDLPNSGLSDGEQTIYFDNGKVQTIAEYKDGKANGRVRKFFIDGKLYMDAMYKNGLKEGKCTYYYKTGKAYTVASYKEGMKEGIEKKYYEEGNLMAEIPYAKNKTLPGLKEYKKDGSLVPNDVYIIVKEEDKTQINETYLVKAYLSNPRINARIQCYEASKPDIKLPLKVLGNQWVLDFPLSKGNFYMKKLVFTAEYKTTRGNIMRIEKPYNLAIDM